MVVVTEYKFWQGPDNWEKGPSGGRWLCDRLNAAKNPGIIHSTNPTSLYCNINMQNIVEGHSFVRKSMTHQENKPSVLCSTHDNFY